MDAAAPLASVTRDGFVESWHHGHVAVADADGALRGGLGDPCALVYPRSSLKPFQAVATLGALGRAGDDLPGEGIAITSASHQATGEQQVEAAYLLARAGLDESALGCPPARPADDDALAEDPLPTSLAHNCSGKHAGFLLAHTAAGGDPGDYLDPAAPLQRRVRDELARWCGATPEGPGIDGCGAPAWRLPLSGLAVGFARLAAATSGPAARVREAMVRYPHLVGGAGRADTALMRAQPGLVAKSGAEGVLAVGWAGPEGPMGVAVKVADGAGRATGPVMATVLALLGAAVPEEVRCPPVLGGGRPHGSLAASPAVEALLATRR